jgi:stage II sporulation protein D
VERQGRGLRAVSGTARVLAATGPTVIIRPVGEGTLLIHEGRRYRGELRLTATDSGVLVVNRLPLESYLRGVVPREIGERTAAEAEAVAAQAVAARSYAYLRLRGSEAPFDVVATTGDQVYGGADAERPLADAAVERTAAEVLEYEGRIVSAPYHSTCGGSTAEPQEVWRSGPEPWLRRVSDRIPGTDRAYCDPSPRYRWTRTFDSQALTRTLDRYLRRYARVSGPIGVVRAVVVESRTESGRVGTLAVETDRGRYVLRANDIRYVFRSPGGEILNSTYFSVASSLGRGSRLTAVSFEGAGYGHGIGMCQWGAIGRARAGQDYRTILRTYYPGTTVGLVD